MSGIGSRRRFVALAALFVVAVGVAVFTVRPIQSASVGPDAAAPVIEFRRLLAGQQVEGHLTQTSKPLLDVVYGPLFVLTGDWRAVAWSAIAAFGLVVVLATVLAHRVGGLASAAFAAVAFTLSPILLVDLSLAYGITWLALFLLIAGLCVTAARTRYAIAGLALMLATLVRPEAIAITGLSLVTLVGMETVALAGRGPRPAPGAYLVLLGFLAVPILMVHDQLVFGDPQFWLNTAVQNSQGRSLRGVTELIRWMGRHVLIEAALLPLALAASWLLVTRREWRLAVGLLGLTAGIAGLLVVSSARGTQISTRYLESIDLGLLFAAALGVAVLDAPALRRWLDRRLRPALRSILPAAVLGLLVAVSVAPLEPLSTAARASIAQQVQLHANAQRALEAIRQALVNPPSWRGEPPSQRLSTSPLVVVPSRIRAQAVAQLDLPLNVTAYNVGRYLDPLRGHATPGSFIYHDRIGDPVDARTGALEITAPTVIGPYLYVPVLVDPAAGLWVLRVEQAPSS